MPNQIITSPFKDNTINMSFFRRASAPTANDGTSVVTFPSINEADWGDWYQDGDYLIAHSNGEDKFAYCEFDSTCRELMFNVKGTQNTGWFYVYQSLDDGTTWTKLVEFTANLAYVKNIGYEGANGITTSWTLPAPVDKWDPTCTEQEYDNGNKVSLEFYISFPSNVLRRIRIIDKGIGLPDSNCKNLGGTNFYKLQIFQIDDVPSERRPFGNVGTIRGGIFNDHKPGWPSGLKPFINKYVATLADYNQDYMKKPFEAHGFTYRRLFEVFGVNRQGGDLWFLGMNSLATIDYLFTANNDKYLCRCNKYGYFLSKQDSDTLGLTGKMFTLSGATSLQIDGTNMFMSGTGTGRNILAKFVIDSTGDVSFDSEIKINTNYPWNKMFVKNSVIYLLLTASNLKRYLKKYDYNLNLIDTVEIEEGYVAGYFAQIDITDDNRLFVVLPTDRTVRAFNTTTGAYLYEFGASGSNVVGGLQLPRGMAIDSAGRPWVSDQGTIQAWKGDGYIQEGDYGFSSHVDFVVGNECGSMNIWLGEGNALHPEMDRNRVWCSATGGWYNEPELFAKVKDVKPIVDTTATSLFYDCTNKMDLAKSYECHGLDGTNLTTGYEKTNAGIVSRKVSPIVGFVQPLSMLLDGTNLLISDTNNRVIRVGKDTGLVPDRVADETCSISDFATIMTTVSPFVAETEKVKFNNVLQSYGMFYNIPKYERYYDQNLFFGYHRLKEDRTDFPDMKWWNDEVTKIHFGVADNVLYSGFVNYGNYLYAASTNLYKIAYDSTTGMPDFKNRTMVMEDTGSKPLWLLFHCDGTYVYGMTFTMSGSEETKIYRASIDGSGSYEVLKTMTGINGYFQTCLKSRHDSANNRIAWFINDILRLYNIGTNTFTSISQWKSDSTTGHNWSGSTQLDIMAYDGKFYIPTDATSNQIVFFENGDTEHDPANKITLDNAWYSGGVWNPTLSKYVCFGGGKVRLWSPADGTVVTLIDTTAEMPSPGSGTNSFYDSVNDLTWYVVQHKITEYDEDLAQYESLGVSSGRFYKTYYFDGTNVEYCGYIRNFSVGGNMSNPRFMTPTPFMKGDVLVSAGPLAVKFIDSTDIVTVSYVKDSTNNMFSMFDATVGSYLESFRLIVREMRKDSTNGNIYYMLPYYENSYHAGLTWHYFMTYSEFEPKVKKYNSDGTFVGDMQLLSKGYFGMDIITDDTGLTQLWVTSPATNEIDIYDADGTKLYTLTDSTAIVSPARICMDDAYAYVSCGDKLTVLDKSTRAVVRSLTGALYDNVKDIAWDGTNIWILNYQKVWQIDTTTGDVLAVADPAPDLYNEVIFDMPFYSRIVFENPTTMYIAVSSGDPQYGKDKPMDRVIKYVLS